MTEQRQKIATPIWLIGSFVGLAEVVSGLVVSQTDGGAQIAILSFVIGYPFLVSGAFFAILWDRPWVLYPPAEFGNANVKDFVQTIRGQHIAKTDAFIAEEWRPTFVQKYVDDPITQSVLHEAITSGTNDLSEVVKQLMIEGMNESQRRIQFAMEGAS